MIHRGHCQEQSSEQDAAAVKIQSVVRGNQTRLERALKPCSVGKRGRDIKVFASNWPTKLRICRRQLQGEEKTGEDQEAEGTVAGCRSDFRADAAHIQTV